MKCVSHNQLLKFIHGDLQPENKAALAAHLESCKKCRKRKEEIIAITNRLKANPGEFDRVDVAPDILTLVRMGRTQPRWLPFGSTLRPDNRVKWIWAVATASVLFALALPLGIYWNQKEAIEDNHGFSVRGSVQYMDRWISIQIFRKTSSGYEPISDHMSTDETMAFAYQNRQEGQFNHLTILGVDATGQVFWYYPAYTDGPEVPRSVSIASTQKPITLPDEVQHHLSPGLFRMFAIFSGSPFSITQVEKQLAIDFQRAGSLESLSRIQLQGTGQHTILLQVGKDRWPG
jgi:hypothetical protein